MRRLVTLALVCAGCGGAPSNPGLEALLRVSGAQYYEGPAPAAQDGPAILQFNNTENIIRPGQVSKPLSGIVTRDTTGVALFLDGDRGYWVIEPGSEDPTADNNLTFSAKLSFAPDLAPGMYTLEGRAVNAAGQFGPPSTATLSAAPSAPAGTLVITLTWLQQADLDLHVVDPDGIEIWAKNQNSYTPPPPGSPPDPNGWMSGGILDYDSNSQCVIDGRRQEDVYWTVPPPSGHYVVRVDAFSLCGEIQADWTVGVTLDGNALGAAFGTLRDSDTMFPHVAGAGVLALEFDVP